MSPFDILIENKALQKTLESDNLIIVEGVRNYNQPDFLDKEEVLQIEEEGIASDIFSAGDFEGEMTEKIDILNQKD